MKARYILASLALIPALSLPSCRSVSMKDLAGIDLEAAEATETYTDPMELSPAVDPFDIRLPIITMIVPENLDQMDAIGNTATARTSYESTNRLSAPIGVCLGNGLSIDYRGNVYIDPFVHLVEETADDFVLTNMNRRVEKTGRSVRITAPMAASTNIELKDDGIVVKKAMAGYSVELEPGKANLIPESILTVPRASVAIRDDTAVIEYQKLFITRIATTLGPEGAIFNGRKDVSFPSYTVTKRGDAYTIVKMDRANPETYKVYFLDRKILVFANGRLRDVFEFDERGVRMNKKPFIVIKG